MRTVIGARLGRPIIERREAIAWILAVAYFLVFIGWVTFRWISDTALLVFDDLSLVIVPILAGAACLSRATGKTEQTAAWILLGLGMMSWGVGHLIWSYYEIAVGTAVPFPSLADVGYLLFIPLVAAAFVLLFGRPGEHLVLGRVVLDGFVIAVSLFAVSWILVLGPLYKASAAGSLATVIGLTYPLGDVLLLALLLNLASQAHRPLRGPWLLVGSGIALFVIADSGFAYLTTRGDYSTGHVIDAAWLAGFLLVGLATFRPTGHFAIVVPGSAYEIVQNYTLLYMPVLVALVAAAAQQLAFGVIEQTIVWSGITLIVLATSRQLLAHLEIRRLTRDLRQSNERLARRSGRLEAAQTISTFGSWEWDTVTNHVTWSPELYRIFGVDPGFDPTLELYISRVHPDDRRRVQEAITGALQDGEPFEFEHRVVQQDGAIRMLHCRGLLEHGTGLVPLKMLGTAQDVTAEQEAQAARMAQFRAEQELEQARHVAAFKTNFINTAAHELNTPLTPIRMQVHMLRNMPDDVIRPEAKRRVEILDRNVERMAKLVSDVLDATRIQAERLALKPENVLVGPLVKEAVESYQAVARAKGINITTRLDRVEAVWMDPDRGHQILANLLSNAIKFTPSGGNIVVGVASEGNAARLTVTDTGRGLLPGEVERLFKPFSQVHDPMEITDSGTGLGLYVCKGLVEAQGGKLWVESEGRGRGSSFHFLVPTSALGNAIEDRVSRVI
ncbi:MAG TPA: ATP-binding protein [Candidatus Thermoplasmatota archaeon]